MPTFITTSNGASVTLPARSRAFEFTVWGAGGGSGGVDAGGTGGRGGDGSRLFGTVQDSSFGRTITAYIGGGGGGGGGCVTSAGAGSAGSSSVAAGGTGGNSGGSGCSGGGGGGGGASALYLGGSVIAVAGGGGGGGGANLNTGQSGGGGDSLSRGTTTSLSLSGGQNGTNKSGDGAGAGAGGGGSDGGVTGLVGQDRSFGATGGSGGRSYYNTTFVSTVSHFGNGDQSYGYGTPNGNSISGTAGAVSVVYPRLDFFGIAIGTENSTEGNVTGTVGDSVELTWATTDVDDVLINSVNEGNASNGVVSTKFYNGLTAGTTTFALLGRFRGLTGVEQSRSVTLLAPPTINSFTASPSTYVTKNNAITLTWNTTNAVQVDITVSVDGGITTTIINNGSADGSTSYTPTVAGTLTFTLYAENAVGTGLGRVSTTTTVISVNPPVINSITNNPVIPDQDSTFTLSWDTTDATTVSIPGLGSNLPGDGNQSVIATVDQSGAGGYPGAPSFGNGYRDYTITASNLAGTTVSSSLRVFIKPQPPRITLYSISPSEVNFGGTITFTWTTIYSLSGSINSSVGATTPIASGTKTAIVTGNIQDFVSNSTKTYTMSVTGYGGTESNSYNVNVLIDTTPDSWVFSSKTGAAINTTYYASSLGTSPL